MDIKTTAIKSKDLNKNDNRDYVLLDFSNTFKSTTRAFKGKKSNINQQANVESK